MSINGNESELISIISGSFEYEGQTYVASPDYIAQAEAYLDQDDVDCTDEQKSKAISQIYGSVAEGVQEGYLVPAGGGNANHKKNAAEETETEGTPETKASKEKQATASGKWTDTVAGKTAAETAAETAAPETTVDAASEAARREQESIAAESSKAEAAKEAEHYRKTHNPLVQALEQVGGSGTEDELAAVQVQSIPFPTEAVTIADSSIAGAVLICLILGLLNRRYRMAGHRKTPRRNRHILSIVLSVCIAAAAFLLTGLITLHYGFYSKDNLSAAFVRTGYYESRYKNAKAEIDAFSGAIGIPPTVFDSSNLEQWYKFEMRKTILKNNESGYFEKTVVRNVQKPINDYLSTQDIELTDQANTGLANMINSLIKSFKSGLNIPGLEDWYTAAESETGKFFPAAIVTILLMAAAVAVTVVIQQHKRHALFYLGTGYLIGAAAELILFSATKFHGRELLQNTFGINAGDLMTHMLISSMSVWCMITALTGLGGLILILMNVSLNRQNA